MTQDQLTDIDILAIENELSITLNFNYTIDIFDHQKSRKVFLINLVIDLMHTHTHIYI